jgi:hypothetical protein
MSQKLFPFFGILLVIVGASANDIFLNQKNSITSKIEELIPKDARRFYNELSSEDREVLQDVVQNGNKFPTTDALLDNIKGRSSILYDKAVRLIGGFREALDSLGPDARKFVDDTIDRLRNLGTNITIDKIKSEFLNAADRYQQLSADAREDLKNAFPMVAGVFQNPVFRGLTSMVFGVSLDDFNTNPNPVTLAPSGPEVNGDSTIEPPVISVTASPPSDSSN